MYFINCWRSKYITKLLRSHQSVDYSCLSWSCQVERCWKVIEKNGEPFDFEEEIFIPSTRSGYRLCFLWKEVYPLDKCESVYNCNFVHFSWLLTSFHKTLMIFLFSIVVDCFLIGVTGLQSFVFFNIFPFLLNKFRFRWGISAVFFQVIDLNFMFSLLVKIFTDWIYIFIISYE